ncbi:MAG: hypothetical protein QXY96_06420 [Candidatus Methanomethylicaceae archaeon]
MEEEKVLLEEILEIKEDLLSEIPTLPITLIFDDKQTEKDLQPLDGIKKYGPYDHNTSVEDLRRDFKEIEIFVFYPKGEKTICESLSKLMEILSEGYNKKREMADVNFEGLREAFKLKNVYIPEPNDFIEYRVGELCNEIKNYINEIDNVFKRGNKPLVIIGGSTHRTLTQKREQYIEAKKEFTSINVPSQYVSYYEHGEGGLGLLYQVLKDSQKHNVALGNAIWNLCLNIYGKVGGIAWITKQRLSSTTNKIVDLSIGLRFSRSRQSKGYKVGYATILDRFGRLIGTVTFPPFQVKGMKIPKEHMRNFMLGILEKALNDERIRKIYESGKKKFLNVAIHRLNFFDLDEIVGIKEALNKLQKNKNLGQINYSLVSVIEKPTFVSFDKTTKFGNVIRGTAFMINEKSAILYTAGSLTPKDEKPLVYPIIISCQNLKDENSIFDTMEEVCNHVLNLSVLHWQTVIPASVRLPATLEFAQNIANLSSYGIQPPINSWLDRTLWFI